MTEFIDVITYKLENGSYIWVVELGKHVSTDDIKFKYIEKANALSIQWAAAEDTSSANKTDMPPIRWDLAEAKSSLHECVPFHINGRQCEWERVMPSGCRAPQLYAGIQHGRVELRFPALCPIVPTYYS